MPFLVCNQGPENRCKGLKWVGKDMMPAQCNNKAQNGSSYCGVHLKALPYGDVDAPKDHPGCLPYLPTKPIKGGQKFWKGLKQKMMAKAKPAEAPPQPPLLAPPRVEDPVEMLLQHLLQHRAKEQLNGSSQGTGLLLSCCYISGFQFYFSLLLSKNLSEVPKGGRSRRLQWRRSSLQAGHATHYDLVNVVHLIRCDVAPIHVPL